MRKTVRSPQRDRAPILTKGHNFEVGLKVLPPAVKDRLRNRRGACAPRALWTAPRLKSSAKGRGTLRCGRVGIGPEREPVVTADHIRARGLFATKSDRNHVDANFDRVMSMRAPFAPGQFHQRQLLAVSGKRASRALPIVNIPMIRMSARQPESVKQVRARCPDGIHEFELGQGAGTTALAGAVYVAAMARAEGYRVKLDVRGEADRFLRTGSLLGRLVLKGAGIYVAWRGRGEDCPRDDGLNHRRVNSLRLARRLRAALDLYVRHLVMAAEVGDPSPPLPGLNDLVEGLDGLRETLACGAGLDWLRRDEAFEDGIGSDHTLQTLASLPSFAPFAGPGGFWLMEAGYRYRRRSKLETKLRPIVLRGRERACMRLFRARWPQATFKKPLVIDCAWRGPTEKGFFVPDSAAGERAVKMLAEHRDETFVCVDHTMIHFGSVVDLDTLVRQRGCSLHAVLPSSFLHPEITRELLDGVLVMMKDARRMARAIDGVVSPVQREASRLPFESVPGARTKGIVVSRPSRIQRPVVPGLPSARSSATCPRAPHAWAASNRIVIPIEVARVCAIEPDKRDCDESFRSLARALQAAYRAADERFARFGDAYGMAVASATR